MKYVDIFLQDFIPNPEPTTIWDETEYEVGKILRQIYIKIPKEEKIRDPYIVFLLLVNIKKFPFTGQWEKVAWDIPIKYKNVEFILSHRKFGFAIIALEKDAQTISLGTELNEKLRKAIPYCEKLIEPVVRQKVINRELTVSNEFNSLLRRYNFFREKASEEFKRNYQELSIHDLTLDEYFTETEKCDYYTCAMLDAFFSLLEHTLVGLIPFMREKKFKKIDVERFILENWKSKYKFIFDLGRDELAKETYDKLLEIKENFRNPFSHGNYLRDGSTIQIHMEHVGAIPMKLTRTKQNLNFSFKGVGNK